MQQDGIAQVEQLLQLLVRSDASELVVETAQWRLRACRTVAVEEPEQAEPLVVVSEKPREPVKTLVRSPMVGYFRARPKPLQVGDRVTMGEVMCLVLAMGLPNEVRSPVEGRVAQILAEEGEAVEYGQPLYEIIEENHHGE